MKFRLSSMVISLALSLVLWAQDKPATSAPNATPETKSCCHHATGDAKNAEGCCGKNQKCEMKEGKSCCSGMEAKDAKPCCGGKDAKTCVEECKKNGSCADGKCCRAGGEKSAKGCCGKSCERHALAS